MVKECPDGKVLNPKTGRCVKIDGKIGRTLVDKECPEGKILNKQTGRCVKIDGKVGKKLSKIVSVIFEPILSQLANSSFDSGRSKSSIKRKNIWTSTDINKYLQWYSTFNSKLAEAFRKNNMQFIGFSKYNDSTLLLQFRAVYAKELAQALRPPASKSATGLKAVKLALNPDQYEEYIVMFDNRIHLVECAEIVSVEIK